MVPDTGRYIHNFLYIWGEPRVSVWDEDRDAESIPEVTRLGYLLSRGFPLLGKCS